MIEMSRGLTYSILLPCELVLRSRIFGQCGQGWIKLVGGPGVLILVGPPDTCVKLTLPSYLLTNNNLLKL